MEVWLEEMSYGETFEEAIDENITIHREALSKRVVGFRMKTWSLLPCETDEPPATSPPMSDGKHYHEKKQGQRPKVPPEP